jgi:hypothetical protein
LNDLPASWAGLAPYLFVAAAAVTVVAVALDGRRRTDRREQPVAVAAGQEAARLWTVSPPWEPALRAAGSATRRVARDPLLGAAIALAAFGLAIGREPVVAFLGLFLVPTMALGPGVFRGGGGLVAFSAFAASDLSLVLGLMHRHAATGVWTTPAPGHVGAGALLVALAAGLRLAGLAGRPDPGSGRALTRVGWFQGLFLAWWAGPSAGLALAVVAVALWAGGIATARAGRAASGLLFAGSLAALLAGLGAGAATVAVVGLAGISFTMGERAVSIATLALIPLSAPAAAGIVPALRPWLPAALGLFVIAWAAALHHLLIPATVPARARIVPAVAAAAGTVAVLATRGGETVAWGAYGLGIAGILGVLAVRPGNMHYRGEPPAEAPEPDEHPGQSTGLSSMREAALAALGAALLLVALLVLAGLTLNGLRTSFL